MLQSESISNGISSKGEHMKNRPGLKQYIFAALGVVILVLLDQYTKLLAIAHLKDQSAFVLWNNVFELHYLENRGAAFGIFQNQRWFFVIMTVVILVIVSWFYGRTPVEKRYLPLRICMIILTAGAIGNFIDRLTRGYVVDFFYFSLIDFPCFFCSRINFILSTHYRTHAIISIYSNTITQYLCSSCCHISS